MLSAALALVLSQTPVADKPAPPGPVLLAPRSATNCPLNGSIEASDPAIARPNRSGGLRNGFPDMVHLPPTVLMATLNRTINGCFTPLILATDVTVRLKQATPSGPGVR